jgi:hypothetical protein
MDASFCSVPRSACELTLQYVFITVMPIIWLSREYHSLHLLIIGLFRGMELAKEAVKKWPMKTDDRLLEKLFDALIKGSDLVRFFERIHGFSRSSLVEDPANRITNLGRTKLEEALIAFLTHTWPSDFLTDSDKMGQLADCVRVTDIAHFSHVSQTILQYIFPLQGSEAPTHQTLVAYRRLACVHKPS